MKTDLNRLLFVDEVKKATVYNEITYFWRAEQKIKLQTEANIMWSGHISSFQ